ncbi:MULTISPECIES: SpoIIIAC/SpoIIIAD family protein [Sedimentibacter]|uniref:Stage III sporulation protein AD n=2 Tax=root TaxID=1 RepID=A0A562JI20_9FIRM|nr:MULTISPECIES: SpoIIIAC/SpoIIIAD family protein [Sedimentibacter]TWH82444.1 stage III sporulation protein AD [Sedimentibacter saalensis]
MICSWRLNQYSTCIDKNDMLLAKIIFIAVITVILSITISKFNPEFKVYITAIFGILVVYILFRELRTYVLEIVNLFNRYNLKTEYFSTILKIVGIAYICDFISLLCKDLSYESVGKKVEIAGKIIILIYSMDVIKIFLDQILLLVNG